MGNLASFCHSREQLPQPEQGEEPLTQTGAVVGTPAFMAPEQAGGGPLDSRADLFSLGCVLYRAVTGRLPFQGAGMMDVLLALATQTPPAPHEVNPEVPPALSALIMNLLAKDRSARPTSAAAVAGALDQLKDNSTSTVPLAIPAVPPREESNPWAELTEVAEQPAQPVAPRGWWQLPAAAALLLVLCGALVTWIVFLVKNKDGKQVAHIPESDNSPAQIKPAGDPGKPKVEPGEMNPDRRAAEWVLSIGGSVGLRVADKQQEIAAAKDLPRGGYQLEWVRLAGNRQATDAGIANLAGLTNLTSLDLVQTPVSDAGLIHLKGLTNLTHLELSGRAVGDAGMAHLAGLTKLTRLGLPETNVGDAGLAHFKGLTKLTALGLSETIVGDAGLEHLKGLPKLTHLWLNSTRVSSAGLEHLKGLTSAPSRVRIGVGHLGDSEYL